MLSFFRIKNKKTIEEKFLKDPTNPEIVQQFIYEHFYGSIGGLDKTDVKYLYKKQQLKEHTDFLIGEMTFLKEINNIYPDTHQLPCKIHTSSIKAFLTLIQQVDALFNINYKKAKATKREQDLENLCETIHPVMRSLVEKYIIGRRAIQTKIDNSAIVYAIESIRSGDFKGVKSALECVDISGNNAVITELFTAAADAGDNEITTYLQKKREEDSSLKIINAPIAQKPESFRSAQPKHASNHAEDRHTKSREERLAKYDTGTYISNKDDQQEWRKNILSTSKTISYRYIVKPPQEKQEEQSKLKHNHEKAMDTKSRAERFALYREGKIYTGERDYIKSVIYTKIEPGI
jgi:hypothetical protein